MFWPRSITSRTMLAVGGLMLLSYVISIILIVMILKKPVAQSTITYLTRHIAAVYTGLDNMPKDQKIKYLSKLESLKQIKLQSAEQPNTPPGHRYRGPIVKRISTLIGVTTEVRVSKIGKQHIAWVKLGNIKPRMWLGVTTSPGNPRLGLNFIFQLIVIIVLSAIAVLLTTARLVKPVKKLAAAAALLGKGTQPKPLPENGPREIQQLCQAFNQMAVDINQLAEDRNLLLAGISHDLRTPLARMRLAVEMLDSKIDPDLRSSILQDMEDINNIVSQFLAYARDGSEESIEAVNITELVVSVTEYFIKQDRFIKLTIDNKLPVLMGRPVSLRRLLINLVNNAVEYGQHEVEISVSSSADSLSLSVKDRGPGIPENQISNILRPFSRNSNSRTDAKHAGLGLAIVHRIVQIHGAEIKITNRDNGGLKICIDFPLGVGVSQKS